jgi:hypothetical protein
MHRRDKFRVARACSKEAWRHSSGRSSGLSTIRGPANLAGVWSAQPVPASPPRAAHRPAAARAPRTDDAGVGAPAATHARLGGPANSLSAVRVRGRRAVVKDAGVRPPNDGQAAADDAPPRPPEDAAPAAVQCTSCVYSCRSVDPHFPSASCTLRIPICHHFAVAFAFAASRARPCSASLVGGQRGQLGSRLAPDPTRPLAGRPACLEV